MLLTLALILAALWLLGFIGHIGAGFIHLLIVIAVIMLVMHMARGRRAL
jgi:hypothetical protein